MLSITYTLHSRILHLLTSISFKLGEVKAAHLERPSPLLQQAYRVSAVYATLAVEGNPLEPVPMAELMVEALPGAGAGARAGAGTRAGAGASAGARAGASVGASRTLPAPSSLEVTNTQRVHDLLPELDPFLAQDFRRAHAEMMRGLALDAGRYRTGPVDVHYGDHQALRPASAENLASQVEELLYFAENDDAPLLITSCMLHYGIAHLKPFSAGNGRMARLWQRRVLMRQWPVFNFLPVEAFILKTVPAYHAALEYADRQEDCGNFIAYVMERIDEALGELLANQRPVHNAPERMAMFLARKGHVRFNRKDYREMFPELSTATASRDLKDAVTANRLERSGDGRTAVYTLSP